MTTFEIGECFENYCLENIFKIFNFSIVEKSHNFNDKRFIESNLKPDFKLRCRETNIEFWVECKFSTKRKDTYTVNEKQLLRYKEMSENIFYIFGFGKPEKPYKYCILPLDKIQPEIPKELINTNLFKSEIKNFNELTALTSKNA